MSYKKAYEDHSFLFGIGPASDMTGGYVDSEDLDKLLKSPSRKTAEGVLWSQRNYWFQVGTEGGAGGDYCGMMPVELVDEFPRIAEIAEEYNFDIY